MTVNNVGRKDLVWLRTLTSHSLQEVKQSRNLEAAAGAEATEDAAYWLSPHGLLSLLSEAPGPAAQGWHHPQ